MTNSDLEEGWIWDKRYQEMPWPTEPDPLLVKYLPTFKKGRALDVGAGTGRNSIFLAKHGFDVVAIDASKVGLQIAEKNAKAQNVNLKLQRLNLGEWEPDHEAFELVVLANMHMPKESLKSLHQKCAYTLVNGGTLFIVGHDKKNFPLHGPPDLDLLFDASEMPGLLPKNIKIKVLETAEREMSDQGHLDIAVVVISEKLKR